MTNDVRILSSAVREHLFGNMISTTTPPRNSAQTSWAPFGALPTAGSTAFGVFCQCFFVLAGTTFLGSPSALRANG